MPTMLERAKADLIERAVQTLHENGAGMGPLADAGFEDFLREYYRRTPPDDLADRSAIDMFGAALAHWQLARHRRSHPALLRVYTPVFEHDHWQSSHTAVEIVTDDMPFLVDSINMLLSRQGYGLHLVVHPVLEVRRDGSGDLVSVRPGGPSVEGWTAESFIHVEIDRQTEPELLAELQAELGRVLADVRAAFEDWRPMQQTARDLVDRFADEPMPVPSAERDEAQALLRWMADDHFTFLGYRDYDLLEEDGQDLLRAVPGTGLGILRDAGTPASRSFAKLSPEVRAKARDSSLLHLTKANAYATVHRPTHLDYVGVKRFDAAGRVTGERRFLGLWSAAAYNMRLEEIPVLRRKLQAVLERAGFPADSHDGKDLLQTLETYPRDELFQISVEDLTATAIGILDLQERRRVRIFVRRDAYGRFFSCLVFVPRERHTTEVRLRMQDILMRAFGGTAVEWSSRLSESLLARLHFLVYTDPGSVPTYEVGEIEAQLGDAARSWTDDLQTALCEQVGEEHGLALFRRYRDAFPAAYREDFLARTAVTDLERLEELAGETDLRMSLYRPLEESTGMLRFKLYRCGDPISLSDVLPMLQNMGVRVVDERPYHVERPGEPMAWIYDFGLRHVLGDDIDQGQVRVLFQEAFARIWRGEVENDGLNRLVTAAALSWREVNILRAYSRYLRQTGARYSLAYMEESLCANTSVARLVVELFLARFDPLRRGDRVTSADRLVQQAEEALDAVASLDQDRILRSFLQVVRATLRTNYFQCSADGAPKSYLSVKLDPAQVPDLPLPRPMFEIFVYSPRMEGVHLRSGRVARGGIRWSDRREDFRTEVLGLMKAQTVKNVVIVPVGSKGGFVVKQPPAGADRDMLMAEVVECYRTLIRGLLDLTDNLVGPTVVPPTDTVRYDPDDAYLVVAADKGTATFSDEANAIAQSYGFWLGDAFASGGSSGYDHKKMGITARGAWESVTRHFRELGIDVMTTNFTVVGIGDMSGDVFGNGMLLSRHIRLLAAFDHRHIMLDPDPDPEASFAERERLFALPRSSWADYDRAVLSPGGAVIPRTAKSVKLSPQVRVMLGVEATALAPNELIRAILQAPADLLWNGGIGTYVKASTETHLQVGDRTNDGVRVNGSQLRARVVGEGGNLGCTQLGRVEFARAGGRINTDAIDNSAGVDCSDHEVNIKILLDAVVADGDMTTKQRDSLLRAMTDEVAALVLRDNYSQTLALSNSRAQAPVLLHAHARAVDALERAGKLDRALEFLPNADAVTERRAAGEGLTAPELAVLLAYIKITVAEALLDSNVPEDPYLSKELERYFPTPLRDRYARQMHDHRLRREIIVTSITNRLVNRAGISFIVRIQEGTGAPVPRIARAHTAAQEIFDLHRLWERIEELDNKVPAAVQTTMLLTSRRLVERATRWLLRNRRPPLVITDTLSFFAGPVATLFDLLPTLVVGADRAALEATRDSLVNGGVPVDLATWVASLEAAVAFPDIVDCAAATGAPVEQVAAVYFLLADRLQLDWLRERIASLRRDERWLSLARAALRDDLSASHRTLTAAVLVAGAAEATPEQQLAAWLAANHSAVERCQQLIADIRTSGTYDLATLPVALREIRGFVEAGAPLVPSR
jgi:glutamate dehydrogenase